MTGYRYPPRARLHRPAEFAAALKGRWIGKGAWLVLSAGREPVEPRAGHEPVEPRTGHESAASDAARAASAMATPTSAPHARLGLIIAKRYAPLSVTRNALKRVIREAFRLHRHALPARDYVVRLHSKVAAGSLTQIKRAARAEIERHFQRVLR